MWACVFGLVACLLFCYVVCCVVCLFVVGWLLFLFFCVHFCSCHVGVFVCVLGLNVRLLVWLFVDLCVLGCLVWWPFGCVVML